MASEVSPDSSPPPTESIYVESSTKATNDASNSKEFTTGAFETTSSIGSEPLVNEEAKEVSATPPTLVLVTEGGPSETTKAAEDNDDSGSVVSMPAAVPTQDATEESTSSPLLSQQDNDMATVASAPAVVVDISGDIGNSEIEDILQSPSGNNAIVERSPGGRYVRFMEKLGSGASKDVYRAYDTQEGIEVAWNVVHLAGVPKNERNRIVNEVRLLERLHHHNIISFHGSWVNREKQQVNFVTEILSSGTLQSFINKVQVIRWKIAKRWALQILKGLEYLHAQEPPVIHRDLKCENIFINGTSGDLRIGDLGLSTVHRNGKALSVLGTPEFMAPDMYEESAYDEKVDIYAFGMCMLEIFTKEIPYRECNNPAQIYKKVIRGDPPDNLKRLKSRHARDFINLCLGTKDDDGNYERPSATELIAHPFLQQRPSDNDEVEVAPPLQERTIKEVPETSSGGSKIAAAGKAIQKVVKPSNNGPKGNGTPNSSPKSKSKQTLSLNSSTNSLSEDAEPDNFEEMPDSERAFRQPIVLMGRGQELQRDEELAQAGLGDKSKEKRESFKSTNDQVIASPSSNTPVVKPEGPGVGSEVPLQQVPVGQQQTPASSFHFLVAAAVIEDEFANTQPYEDDILKLVVTLPVEGQTQNVQFDFHLVEDDAIQVAKEMVSELAIPQAAILEISETISGLARAARVKQEKYLARVNTGHHQRSRSTSQGTQGYPEIRQAPPQHQSIGHAPNMVQTQSHSSIPDYMQTQHGGQTLQPQSQQVIASQGQHAAQMQMPQQQNMADGSTMPMNQQMQNPSMQQIAQGEHSIQTMPSHMHGQRQQQQPSQQQQNWNTHPPTQNNAPGPQAQRQDQSTFPQASIVRSVSNGNQIENASQGPAYSQIPAQQQRVQGNDPQSGYGQVQQGPPQQQQQNHNSFGQMPMQHMSNQQTQGQSNGQSGVEGHIGYQQHQQAHLIQPPQQGMQHAGQSGHIQSSGNYGQQQPQPQMMRQPMQVQGNNGHNGMAYQTSMNEQHNPAFTQNAQSMQGQGLMQQQSQHQQIVQNSPNQQMHGLNNQHQGYGQNSAPQQQHHHPGPNQNAQQATQHQFPTGSSENIRNLQHQPELEAQQMQSRAVAPPMQSVAVPPQNQKVPIAITTRETSATESRSNLRESSSLSEEADTKDNHMNGVHGAPSFVITEDEDDPDNEMLVTEMRKLDEEYKKSMARAQKVFDTRMDTLSRTQVQREAQHQKTLEKHQKEKADFEKRRQQEEIEQNRRIEQLKKDWAERRKAMRQKKVSDESQMAQSSASNLAESSDDS